MDKVIEKILKDTSTETGVSIEEVNKIYTEPYKIMRDTICKIDLNGKTEEDLDGIKSNFNMPKLFKLYVDKWLLNKINKKHNEQTN